MPPDTDVLIVGGGPVGAALALALRRETVPDLRITVLEARAAASDDQRPIALAQGSRLILERLGAWQALKSAPILQIHVSQKGSFGRAVLAASEADVPALGYVADYNAIFAALSEAVRVPGCDYRAGARATAIHPADDEVSVDYYENAVAKNLSARLVVVADGGELEGLAPQKVTDYSQCALTARVRTQAAHAGTAYERFTVNGPLALLPYGEEMALVWTLQPARAELLLAADETDFLAALGEAFGGRLGAFRVVQGRDMYPLALRRASGALPSNCVAIGNAAQTLHPVAGQGFNLGLRDAWELAQLLGEVGLEHIGAQQTLQRFQARRRLDRGTTIGVTHALVKVFSNDYFAVDTLRGVGMTLLGSLPPLQTRLARRMMFGAHL
jgi:2-octaprenyl-6-methoxyphenol hydroxylase